MSKSVRFMDKTLQIFNISNISKIEGPVTFLLYKLERYFFKISVDIKLLLEFKDSFVVLEKIFFPKNHKNWSEKIAGFWLKF